MNKIELELKEQYLMDDCECTEIIEKMINENQVILLVAPQGVGKSEYLKKLKMRKLYLSPTVSLANQVEQTTQFSASRGTNEHTYTCTITDIYGNSLYGDISSTFASSEGVVEMQHVPLLDVVIIDEAHKFIQYSNFAYNSVKALKKTINEFITAGKKVIYVTATPIFMDCLKNVDDFPLWDCEINIQTKRNYISKCILVKNFSDNRLLDLVIKNISKSNFQIILYNNTKGIKRIAEMLNARGIKATYIDASKIRDNESDRQIIQNYQNGIYDGCRVLLATSWIDVGLNFYGKDITHLYCMFDEYYEFGDISIIQQFMARSRCCLPILYITFPQLTYNERKLIEMIETKSIEFVRNEMELIARNIVYNYDRGIIRDIEVSNHYGICKLDKQDTHTTYSFSNLTMEYQIRKLIEKHKIITNIDYLKTLLEVEDLTIFADNEIEMFTQNEYEKLVDYIDFLIDTKIALSIDEIVEDIKKITNGRVVIKRPKFLIESIFPNVNMLRKTKRICNKPSPINVYYFTECSNYI